ncbi:MAG: hypothetical protein AAGJ08_05235 [Cyanobacteria bacterium P01_H01_bin.35]
MTVYSTPKKSIKTKEAIAQIKNGKNPRDNTSIRSIWYKEIGLQQKPLQNYI